MAQKQKRPSPLDEPPTASSSDSEEEQQPSSQQRDEEEEEEDDEEASSEEQEDDDDDDEEEDDQPSSRVQPASKNPPPPPTNTNSHPKTASSESDTETDSGSDSESAPPPTANPKVKPLASKPMEQTPKAKTQSSTAAPTRSASKRPAENNGHVSDPKRAKKKGTDASDDEAEEDGKKSGDESKKLFQRLWSEEDEIAILKGMVEFTSKTGSDPLKYANAFHDFVKKSLHADASSNQLKQKIRRLKKKFETNAGKGKNGEGPSFSKPHDQKSFELSKKVWGNSGGEEKAKTNGKAAKSPKKEASSRNVASTKPKPKPEPKSEQKSEPKSDLIAMDSKEAGKMDIDEKLDTTSHLMEVIRLDKGMGLSGLNEDVVKRGVELIEASKRAELEEEWKELQVAELELYVKRAELIANQARLILEAYKSSNQ